MNLGTLLVTSIAAATLPLAALAQTATEQPLMPAQEQARVDWQQAQSLIRQEEPAANERRDRIKAELANLPQAQDAPAWAAEWSGKYYTGDGRAMNVSITLAPKSGLVYTWHGCTGLYDLNHGDITGAFEGGLSLKLAVDPGVSGYRYMSDRVYFVLWGERHYLVPEAQLVQMVNNYNGGGFAREHMFSIPVKEGDKDKPVEGRPPLPARYAAFLCDHPLKAEIIAVEGLSRRATTHGVDAITARVTLDAGSQHGLYVGLTFSISAGTASGSIEVVEVAERTALGNLAVYVGTDAKVDAPKVGDRVSTGRVGSVPPAKLKTEPAEASPESPR